MAVTQGHGNPRWTRDEIILALDLYFDCEGRIPSGDDPRVQELSDLLRTLPHHSAAARKESFRNADGVAFKLQNLRQLATGKGLGNVSRTDREVWEEFGSNPERTKACAQLIRAGVAIANEVREDRLEYEVFSEGRVVTETHVRRERNPQLRSKLIDQRRRQKKLVCEICGRAAGSSNSAIADSIFEAHHIVPLSAGAERDTKLADLALLCACCHRMVHRAITVTKMWLSMDEARIVINGDSTR